MNMLTSAATALVLGVSLTGIAPASANSSLDAITNNLSLDLDTRAPILQPETTGPVNPFAYQGQSIEVLPVQAALNPPSVNQRGNLHTEMLRIEFN